MKTATTFIIFMLLSSVILAQDGISFFATHDIKLGLGMDKTHKNDEPTLDLIIGFNLEGKQFEYYYFAVQTEYERANLYDGYFSRYSINLMWNFNKLVVPKLTVGLGAGIGIIGRHESGSTGTYLIVVDVSYPITKNLATIIKNEYIRRSDLLTPRLGYNLSIGLNWKPFHL